MYAGYLLIAFFSSADVESCFSKDSFKNTIGVSNSLDPDEAQHFVGPDFGSKLFAKVTERTTLVKQRVKIGVVFGKVNC